MSILLDDVDLHVAVVVETQSLCFGFPVTSDGGEWQIVDGLEISATTRAGIDHNIKALREEYDAVKELGFIK